MDFIGVIGSDDRVNQQLRRQVEMHFGGRFHLHIPSGEEAMLEMLNFDMPEVVVVHFSDQNIDLAYILQQIKDDPWLHNFGIIGVFDKEQEDEKDLFQRYPEVNLLTLLDYGKLKTHFAPSLDIIMNNRQVIFQSQLADLLVDKAAGSFTIQNSDFKAVPVYAGLVATALNRRNFIPPEERRDLQTALAELILNGIEHGNCEITFEEKTQWMMTGREMTELIEEKGSRPEYRDKQVLFEWEIGRDEAQFIIQDDGSGFDVETLRRNLRKGREGGEEALHGRGIQLARQLSDKLKYNRRGNRVTMVVNRRIPRKKGPLDDLMSGGETVAVAPGDTIFQENEFSDFIYYISSGEFEVIHQGNSVGRITPADIFMGELSFLMNNKRSASVKATTRGRLLKISRKAFINIIKEYPHYGIILSRLIGRKLIRANERSAGK